MQLPKLLSVVLSWPSLLAVACLLLYWHLTRTHNHWKNRGIHHIPPVILFGNIMDRILFRKSFHEFQRNMYNTFKGHKYAGFFEGRRPTLMLLDPQLIKDVMVRDFDHFVDRPVLRFRDSLYTQRMLINLRGAEWKSVRTVMTPAFSSGRLKAMEPLVEACGDQLHQFLEDTVEANDGASTGAMEMKGLFGRYTLDVIAACAFGVQCNSLSDSSAEVIKMMARFGDISIVRRLLIFFVVLLVPQFAGLFPLSFFNTVVINYLANIVLEAKRHRCKHSDKRNDFLQLMLDAEHDSKSVDHCGGESDPKPNCGIIDESSVVAQSIIFLIAGYETSSTQLMFASYELALNPTVQDCARQEITSVLARHGGKCCYEALHDMTYLDMVMAETLRKHPPVARVDRTCTVPYQLPGSEVKLQPGDGVSVPVIGLHYDPSYYPDPACFDPLRFATECKNQRSPYVYLPFGAGPRNCIGMRFAQMSTKIAMVNLLTHFRLCTCPKTEVPYKFSKGSMLLKPQNGLWLSIEKL